SAAKPQPQWSVWLALTLARWLPKPATSQFPQKGRSLRDTWSPGRGNSDGANWSADIMVFGDRSWQFLARKAKTCAIVVQELLPRPGAGLSMKETRGARTRPFRDNCVMRWQVVTCKTSFLRGDG